MKILGIVGSPRKNSNTEILVKEALKVARDAGCETEMFLIRRIFPRHGGGRSVGLDAGGRLSRSRPVSRLQFPRNCESGFLGVRRLAAAFADY